MPRFLLGLQAPKRGRAAERDGPSKENCISSHKLKMQAAACGLEQVFRTHLHDGSITSKKISEHGKGGAKRRPRPAGQWRFWAASRVAAVEAEASIVPNLLPAAFPDVTVSHIERLYGRSPRPGVAVIFGEMKSGQH